MGCYCDEEKNGWSNGLEQYTEGGRVREEGEREGEGRMKRERRKERKSEMSEGHSEFFSNHFKLWVTGCIRGHSDKSEWCLCGDHHLS